MARLRVTSPIEQKNLEKASRNLEGERSQDQGSIGKVPEGGETSGELQSRGSGETGKRKMRACSGSKLQDRAKSVMETDRCKTIRGWSAVRSIRVMPSRLGIVGKMRRGTEESHVRRLIGEEECMA